MSAPLTTSFWRGRETGIREFAAALACALQGDAAAWTDLETMYEECEDSGPDLEALFEALGHGDFARELKTKRLQRENEL